MNDDRNKTDFFLFIVALVHAIPAQAGTRERQLLLTNEPYRITVQDRKQDQAAQQRKRAEEAHLNTLRVEIITGRDSAHPAPNLRLDLATFISKIVDFTPDHPIPDLNELARMVRATPTPSPDRIKRYEGLLKVLSQYQFADVLAARELVANGLDAYYHDPELTRLIESPDRKVEVRSNARARTLEIADQGVGMTPGDIAYFLLTPSRSKNNVILDPSSMAQGVTGRFGQGFFSVFSFLRTPTDRLVIETKTAREAPVRLTLSNSGGHYQVQFEVGRRGERGTTMTLHSEMLAQKYEGHTVLTEIEKGVLEKYFRHSHRGAVYVNGQQINPPARFDHSFSLTLADHSGRTANVYLEGSPVKSGKSRLSLLVNGVLIKEFERTGHHFYPNVVVDLPPETSLTQDRTTIDFHDPVTRNLVRQLAERAISQNNLALINSLFPVIGREGFDFQEELPFQTLAVSAVPAREDLDVVSTIKGTPTGRLEQQIFDANGLVESLPSEIKGYGTRLFRFEGPGLGGSSLRELVIVKAGPRSLVFLHGGIDPQGPMTFPILNAFYLAKEELYSSKHQPVARLIHPSLYPDHSAAVARLASARGGSGARDGAPQLCTDAAIQGKLKDTVFKKNVMEESLKEANDWDLLGTTYNKEKYTAFLDILYEMMVIPYYCKSEDSVPKWSRYEEMVGHTLTFYANVLTQALLAASLERPEVVPSGFTRYDFVMKPESIRQDVNRIIQEFKRDDPYEVLTGAVLNGQFLLTEADLKTVRAELPPVVAEGIAKGAKLAERRQSVFNQSLALHQKPFTDENKEKWEKFLQESSMQKYIHHLLKFSQDWEPEDLGELDRDIFSKFRLQTGDSTGLPEMPNVLDQLLTRNQEVIERLQPVRGNLGGEHQRKPTFRTALGLLKVGYNPKDSVEAYVLASEICTSLAVVENCQELIEPNLPMIHQLHTDHPDDRSQIEAYLKFLFGLKEYKVGIPGRSPHIAQDAAMASDARSKKFWATFLTTHVFLPGKDPGAYSDGIQVLSWFAARVCSPSIDRVSTRSTKESLSQNCTHVLLSLWNRIKSCDLKDDELTQLVRIVRGDELKELGKIVRGGPTRRVEENRLSQNELDDLYQYLLSTGIVTQNTVDSIYPLVYGDTVKFKAENTPFAVDYDDKSRAWVPLDEYPLVKALLGKDTTLNRKTILSSMGQHPDPYAWIKETFKNASEAGARRIDLSVFTDPSNQLTLKLTDDGSGIRQDQMHYLFVPGFSTKSPGAEAHDINFGWGFFTLFKYFDDVEVETSPDGNEKNTVRLKKEGERIWISESHSKGGPNSQKKGTTLFLRKRGLSQVSQPVSLKAQLVKTLSGVANLDVSFNEEPTAGLAQESLADKTKTPLKSSPLMIDGHRVGTVEALQHRIRGVYYQGLFHSDTLQAYQNDFSDLMKDLSRTLSEPVVVNLTGDLAQNSNRTAFRDEAKMRDQIKSTIQHATLRAIALEWNKNFDRLWNKKTLPYDFLYEWGPEKDFINALTQEAAQVRKEWASGQPPFSALQKPLQVGAILATLPLVPEKGSWGSTLLDMKRAYRAELIKQGVMDKAGQMIPDKKIDTNAVAALFCEPEIQNLWKKFDVKERKSTGGELKYFGDFSVKDGSSIPDEFHDRAAELRRISLLIQKEIAKFLVDFFPEQCNKTIEVKFYYFPDSALAHASRGSCFFAYNLYEEGQADYQIPKRMRQLGQKKWDTEEVAGLLETASHEIVHLREGTLHTGTSHDQNFFDQQQRMIEKFLHYKPEDLRDAQAYLGSLP